MIGMGQGFWEAVRLIIAVILGTALMFFIVASIVYFFAYLVKFFARLLGGVVNG